MFDNAVLLVTPHMILFSKLVLAHVRTIKRNEYHAADERSETNKRFSTKIKIYVESEKKSLQNDSVSQTSDMLL